MAGKGWQREFDDPIELPNGRRLADICAIGESDLCACRDQQGFSAGSIPELRLVATMRRPFVRA